MKLLICGDRDWSDQETMRKALLLLIDNCHREKEPLHIIHGDARGADKMAGELATKFRLKVTAYPADWEKYKKAAGPIRNTRMLNEGHPDAVLAFHNNIATSKGTANMLVQAAKRGIKTMLVTSHDKCTWK